MRLTDEVLKNNILNLCSASTGATAFYLKTLKSIIDCEKEQGRIQYLDEKTREQLRTTFANYALERSEMNSDYELLIEEIFRFMTVSPFTTFNSTCESNNYRPPYSSNSQEEFKQDVLDFAKAEVSTIINSDSTELFQYKVTGNVSPFPEDQRRNDFGNITVFTTLYGLFNCNKILELKSRDQLQSAIKSIFANQFEILPTESVNDFHNPGYITPTNPVNSSLIIGTDLSQIKLYNGFVDDFHEKVLNGYIWYNDDVRLPYSYLGVEDNSDTAGETVNLREEYRPFKNDLVLSSYHIAYLKLIRIEKTHEDLKHYGYFNSKEEYLRDKGAGF